MRRQCSWLAALVLGLVAGGLASVTLAAKEEALDPTGTWKWETTFRDRTFKRTLRLALKDGEVVGTYERRGEEVDIEKAKIDGERLSFQYTGNWGENIVTVKFSGKISEDTIKGQVDWLVDEQSGTREWEAKRVVENSDVLGTWNFVIVTEDGDKIEPSITITQDGDKLQGAYNSPWGKRDARFIKLKDNVLTFEISGETEDNDFRATYHGKPRGDSIKGSIDYDFGGQTGAIDFEGRRQKDKAKETSPEKKDA